ncbi:MAG: hypothetical protein ABI968_04350 [Acidobacteriota bacterium]
MTGSAWFEETQGFAPWLYILVPVVFLILLGVVTLRQTTTVEVDAVTVRFGFLHKTRIPLSEIAHAEAVSYRPVRDYGGWGIRGFGRRRALNARGNQGVLVTRSDGSTVLIGSQKPRELLAALGRGGVHTEDRLPVVVRDF